MSDTSTQYWLEYTNLQHIKHEMLRGYLGGWYAILTRYNGKVIYFETHAGRGRHRAGQLGSPLIALTALLGHRYRSDILARSKVHFYFIEKEPENLQSLQREIADLGNLPPQITVRTDGSDFEAVLDVIIRELDTGKELAPSLFFVDPFTFLLPVDKLARCMKESKCEMLINFMWRYVDLALHHEDHARNNDAMFGENNWQDLRAVRDAGARCDAAVARMVARLGAKHFWSMKMLGDQGSIKYVLLHVANHPKAFSLMKDVAWGIAPEGDFRIRQSDDPNQEYLLRANPDLAPLASMIWDDWGGRTAQLNSTYTTVDRSIYRRPHYHDLLRKWIKSGHCGLQPGVTRLVFKDNPVITFGRRP